MGAIDAPEWAFVLSGPCIQNDWVSTAMNLHQFCIKLEQSSAETIQMIQKAAGTGTWWLTALSWQWACSCTTSHAVFLGKTSNHSGDLAPQQFKFGTLWLLAFPKTKITFERKEVSDYGWDSGKYDGAAAGDWENCVRPQRHLLWRGLGVIFLLQYFLYLYFFNKCLYFSYYIAGYSLDKPCIKFQFVWQ